MKLGTSIKIATLQDIVVENIGGREGQNLFIPWVSVFLNPLHVGD
jgi:hypothetical protein